jgi:hypothetical protein
VSFIISSLRSITSAGSGIKYQRRKNPEIICIFIVIRVINPIIDDAVERGNKSIFAK